MTRSLHRAVAALARRRPTRPPGPARFTRIPVNRPHPECRVGATRSSGGITVSETFTIRVPDSWQSYDLSGEELASRRAAVLAEVDRPDDRAEVNRMFREVRRLVDETRR